VALIEIDKLEKVYRGGGSDVAALRDVSFSVEKGEFVVVTGASGSGKSTLLNLAGGLDRPTSGDVVFNGRRFSDMDDDSITVFRRQHIGFVFQFFNLIPTLTALENVALPELIKGRKLADCREEAAAALAMVGLEGRAGHRPAELSGGEQQRAAIARGLVGRPSVVLADEPMGNLDSKNSGAILSFLRRARDETGQTILMVSHDYNSMKYADRAIFLRDGGISGEEDLKGSSIDESFLSACIKKYLD